LVLVLVPALAAVLVLDLALVLVPSLGPGSGSLARVLVLVLVQVPALCVFLSARFLPCSLLLRRRMSVGRGKNREQIEGLFMMRMFFSLEKFAPESKNMGPFFGSRIGLVLESAGISEPSF